MSSSSIKTIVTSLVTGAVVSAATTMVIAKVTAKPADPRCEVTGTRLAAPVCTRLSALVASEAAHATALADAGRRLAVLEETVRLTADARFFCVGDGALRTGACFRSADACVAARGPEQVCWHQDDASCFRDLDGATRCASTIDVCVTMATIAGLGAEARGACHRTYVDPPPSPPPTPAPAATP